MAEIKIAILNKSTVLADTDVQPVVGPLQTQVHRDFAPVWGVDADLTFYPKGQSPPAGLWQILILDDSDQAGDLGYHDLTDDGFPQGKVFARTDINSNSAWTVTASHEVLEMLADPDINLYALWRSGNEFSFYSYEVCDPCHLDDYGYKIEGTLMSDFVYPAWFEYWRGKDTTQFDHCKLIHEPFEILPKALIYIYEISYNNGWMQQWGPATQANYQDRPRVGSRRERRSLPRDRWIKSAPRALNYERQT
jgi:hypothetical protein